MKTTKLLSTMILAAMIAACGPQGSLKQTSSNNSGQSTGDNTQTWTEMKTEVDAAADGSQYDGKTMVTLNIARQTLELTVPLPPVTVMPFGEVSFPQLPGATLRSDFQSDGTVVWILSVPLSQVLKKVTLNPVLSLPNGDPIPYVPSGELTGFSVVLPQNSKHRITVYVGIGYIAAFVETPNWELPAGFPAIGAIVKNRAKTRQIGFVEIVPNKSTFSSGIFLAAKLPSDISRTLASIIKF